MHMAYRISFNKLGCIQYANMYCDCDCCLLFLVEQNADDGRLENAELSAKYDIQDVIFYCLQSLTLVAKKLCFNWKFHLDKWYLNFISFHREEAIQQCGASMNASDLEGQLFTKAKHKVCNKTYSSFLMKYYCDTAHTWVVSLSSNICWGVKTYA